MRRPIFREHVRLITRRYSKARGDKPKRGPRAASPGQLTGYIGPSDFTSLELRSISKGRVMESNDTQRCPHYQLYSEPLALDGPPSYLAIRRCLLSERLVSLLRKTADGGALADKLVITGKENRAFAFVGPDLDAVTQTSCTVNRCQRSCTPGYSESLEHFGAVDARQNEITCDSAAPDGADSEESPATCA